MSVQTAISGFFEKAPYRSIVKDGYTTRDGGGENRLEVAAWRIEESDGELVIKNPDGTLRYEVILDFALGVIEHPDASEKTSKELAELTALKSYRDERGGRAASTIRGYTSGDTLSNLPSSHPVKRVLRRWARSQDIGHFENDESTERTPNDDAEPIDMGELFAAYRMARMIASMEGFVFVPSSGEPEAKEDNERIDYDEIRRQDSPVGETHAGVLLEKPDGKMYEYRVDFDTKSLERVGVGSNYSPDLPPKGY